MRGVSANKAFQAIRLTYHGMRSSLLLSRPWPEKGRQAILFQNIMHQICFAHSSLFYLRCLYGSGRALFPPVSSFQPNSLSLTLTCILSQEMAINCSKARPLPQNAHDLGKTDRGTEARPGTSAWTCWTAFCLQYKTYSPL